MHKFLNRKSCPLILSFLAPIFIMACYFAYRNMSPFGHQSIMTVDLGQQYVDLFANFKSVLFNHPSGIFYSFSKSFGGEMFGTWAYYLMSPLNFLLLIIPTSFLPAGILIIISLKYGLSGLSFSYLLSKTIHPVSSLTIMWSTIYALNGWIIANQINIMWLDGMIWLPLVILGINQIFYRCQSRTFIIALALAIITNYYMGYMISFFTIIYIIFKFSFKSLSIHRFKLIIQKLLISILIILGLSAWLTLPTWYSLSQGKAHYSSPHLVNHFEYEPFKMVSKLFNGSLNFSQLPNGTPNIFVGSIALIGFLIYLFCHQFSVRKRLNVLIVTAFLILSMCYQPLDLLWHAGQFPVWYPYRFSYVFCFWVIWIAANVLNYHYYIGWLPKLTIAGILSALTIYVFINRVHFPFITPLHYALGILFLLVAFILLLYTHNGTKLFAGSLLLFSIFEMSTNAYNSLNNLTYINNRNYVQTSHQSTSEVKWIDRHQQTFYRLGKTFYRSKNDPFNNHYAGGDVFDSSLEYTTPAFMQRIGQPEGRGFATYSNGTPISDRLLDFQYFITTNHYHDFQPIFKRNDLQRYPIIHRTHGFSIHRNTTALPLIFTTYPSALHIKSSKNPITYQNRWYHSITHQDHLRFFPSNFSDSKSSNLKLSHRIYHLKNPFKPGYLSKIVQPHKPWAYYLLVKPSLDSRSIQINKNGHPLLPWTTFNHSLILNLSSGQSSHPIKIQAYVRQPQLNSTDFKLYRLKIPELINHPYQKNASVRKFTSCRISGTCTSTRSRTVIGTSIPATKGWHLRIDGKKFHIDPIANEFIGAKVKPGRHTIALTYIPPYLIFGITITLFTILLMALTKIYKNNK